MSNIPDITSLSDLLNTSPSQPVEEKQRNEFPNGILFPDEKQDQSQTNTNVPNNEESAKSPDENVDRIEKLLSRQSIKLNLSNERNELVKKRSSLKTSIDELKHKVKHLQDLKKKQIRSNKIGQLLEENSNRFIETEIPKKVPVSMDKDDSASILKNLHVLPSTDWLERLSLVRKFYPHLEIDKVEADTSYDVNKNSFTRTISYIVVSPLLFRLPITININSPDESVSSIHIPDSVGKDGLMTNFIMLSPSFAKVLILNYILNQKVDLMMFSLNSLSMVIHDRISTMYKLIRTFSKYISTKSSLDDLTKEKEVSQHKINSILKNVDNLQFIIPIEESNTHHFIINLHWEVVLTDTINGECVSRLKLFLIKDVIPNLEKKNIHNSTSPCIIRGTNSLFTGLSKEYGVYNAVSIVFKNIFGITTDAST